MGEDVPVGRFGNFSELTVKLMRIPISEGKFARPLMGHDRDLLGEPVGNFIKKHNVRKITLEAGEPAIAEVLIAVDGQEVGK